MTYKSISNNKCYMSEWVEASTVLLFKFWNKPQMNIKNCAKAKKAICWPLELVDIKAELEGEWIKRVKTWSASNAVFAKTFMQIYIIYVLILMSYPKIVCFFQFGLTDPVLVIPEFLKSINNLVGSTKVAAYSWQAIGSGKKCNVSSTVSTALSKWSTVGVNNQCARYAQWDRVLWPSVEHDVT